MLFWVRIGIGIQVKPDDLKAIPAVKRDRVFVAGLRFQHDHPRPGGLRRPLDGLHQRRADAALPPGRVKHADIADPEPVVPGFGRALDEPEQLAALERAECDRLFQPFAEHRVVKGLFNRRVESRIAQLKAGFGRTHVVIPVRLIPRGEPPARPGADLAQLLAVFSAALNLAPWPLESCLTEG